MTSLHLLKSEILMLQLTLFLRSFGNFSERIYPTVLIVSRPYVFVTMYDIIHKG